MQCTKDDARTVVQFYLFSYYYSLSFFSVRFITPDREPFYHQGNDPSTREFLL